MDRPIIPTEGAVTRTASIEIARDVGAVYHYIIDYKVLPEWLKKYGPIHGIRDTVINTASYTFVGANRTIHFDNGDSIEEQLIFLDPPGYYAYKVTKFSNFFRFLTDVAYGQISFEQRGGNTKVSWTYTFTCKNLLAKAFFPVFMETVYVGFLNRSLALAKAELEKAAGLSS
jgi:hypothetical protein